MFTFQSSLLNYEFWIKTKVSDISIHICLLLSADHLLASDGPMIDYNRWSVDSLYILNIDYGNAIIN